MLRRYITMTFLLSSMTFPWKLLESLHIPTSNIQPLMHLSVSIEMTLANDKYVLYN
jgi:hypothetical protein